MRTFLSLTPDAGTSMAIEKWCSLCWPGQSRKIPMQNYHVTVAFFGDITKAQLLAIEEGLDLLEHPAFELLFDEVRYLPDPSVLWLGVCQVPAAANHLADKCKTIANRGSIRVASRRYQPHLTLARKITFPPSMPLIEPNFAAHFTSLQLMQSHRERSGARYVELNSWKLVEY